MNSGKRFWKLLIHRVLATFLLVIISFVFPDQPQVLAVTSLNACFKQPVVCADLGIKSAAAAPIVKAGAAQVVQAEILDAADNVIGTTTATFSPVETFDAAPGTGGSKTNPTVQGAKRYRAPVVGGGRGFLGQVAAEAVGAAVFYGVTVGLDKIFQIQEEAKSTYCAQVPGDFVCGGEFYDIYGTNPNLGHNNVVRLYQNVQFTYGYDAVTHGWGVEYFALNSNGQRTTYAPAAGHPSHIIPIDGGLPWQDWPQQKRNTAIDLVPQTFINNIINNLAPKVIVDGSGYDSPDSAPKSNPNPNPPPDSAPNPNFPPSAVAIQFNFDKTNVGGTALVDYDAGGGSFVVNVSPSFKLSIKTPTPSPSPSPNPSPSPSPNPSPSPSPNPSPSPSPNPSPDNDCECCNLPSINGDLPSLNYDCQVEFTNKNFVEYAVTKSLGKFPFDIVGGIGYLQPPYPCPTYTFWGQTYEFCIVNKSLKATKWVVWIVFSIKSIVAL